MGPRTIFLALLAAVCPVSASADAPRAVLVVQRSADDADAADLARALRPHLASAEADLRVVTDEPPSDEIGRAAWGAELAARERGDVVVWLDPREDGSLTLRLVDARARVIDVSAPPGDRFDQLRTVALAARSHAARMVLEARQEAASSRPETDSPAVPSAPPAPSPERRLPVSPMIRGGPIVASGGGSLALGGRLETGLRVGPYLGLSLGAELLPAEDLGPDNTPGGGTRTRLPVVLLVAGILPLDRLSFALGVEGALSVAFLSSDASDRVRVSPLLGLRAAAQLALTERVFVEIPVAFRLRLASPGADTTWAPAAVAPGFEAVAGISVGLGG